MLQITLARAYKPSDVEGGGQCGICNREFNPAVVYAMVWTDGGPNAMCERCLLHFADWARSENLLVDWPTREQYFEARRRYTTPYFPTQEDYERAVREGHGDDHYDECWLH